MFREVKLSSVSRQSILGLLRPLKDVAYAVDLAPGALDLATNLFGAVLVVLPAPALSLRLLPRTLVRRHRWPVLIPGAVTTCGLVVRRRLRFRFNSRLLTLLHLWLRGAHLRRRLRSEERRVGKECGSRWL